MTQHSQNPEETAAGQAAATHCSAQQAAHHDPQTVHDYRSEAPADSDEELEIDWFDLLRRILAIRKTLYKAAAIGLVAGIILALGTPKRYTVSVTLSPEMSNTQAGGSALAGLASSFLGVNSGAISPDALNASLSADIVSSTPYLLELFSIPVETLDGKTDTTLAGYLDLQPRSLPGYITGAPAMAIGALKKLFTHEPDTVRVLNPFQLTPEESAKVEALKQAITAEVDKKTSMTTLSVTLADSKVAAQVADSAVSKLQKYIIAYRLKKTDADCQYLEKICKDRRREYIITQERYARYADANRSMILQSAMAEQQRLQNDMQLAYQIYTQIAQQLELARAKIQEQKPVFAVVEPATIPLQPSGTSRKVIVLGVIFLAVCGTAAWKLFGAPYLRRLRSGMSSDRP